MMVGEPSVFAIESAIVKAYTQPSLRGLGFFVIHIRGLIYGIRKEDATTLACSLDAVQNRLAARGKHTASFASDRDASEIASAFRDALFAESPKESFFEIPLDEFRSLFEGTTDSCMMAPDGDEAFDDGSYILQFNVGEQVRLIAFRGGTESLYDPATLSDVWLPAADFYRILEEWRNAFITEWDAAPKVPYDDWMTTD
jgi:hypothetical protein